ncbi:hypothetical protein JKP88DRAFT_279037 [Tribonema minus]|uniref:Uncharacterized protein n=1 Tax=Tribonema minus TaxID=303371 RepID=A0A835YUZ6_9STRA|nr:hypothetical protein JKP88DRAFT_279037 [Tribonema minus]
MQRPRCAVEQEAAQRGAAAKEAVNLAAEVEAMLHVLGDIDPSSSTGVRVLTYTLGAMRKRLLEVTDAARSGDVWAHARASSEAGGGEEPRRTVLASPDLLASIVDFMGCGHWLFVAPVSRSWRTAYMSVTERQQSVPCVCVTVGPAAVETPERLEMALEHGIDVPILTSTYSAQEAAGASGSMEVILRLCHLGMPISCAALLGAACARHIGTLYRLCTLAQRRNVLVRLETWTALHERVIHCSHDDEQRLAALVWLSRQVRPWPVWFCTYLCHSAANGGRQAALKYFMNKDRGQAVYGPLVRDLSVVDFGCLEWRDAPATFRWCLGSRPLLSLMDEAAIGGHVEVLQWLRQEHALPLTPLTMACAAGSGCLPALQWLHRAGCPYDIIQLCEPRDGDEDVDSEAVGGEAGA